MVDRFWVVDPNRPLHPTVVQPHDYGEYVKHRDYATLLAERDAWRENIALAQQIIAERDALATENASLRGNCARMGHDAKHQARALKRAVRERDALAAQVEAMKGDAVRGRFIVENMEYATLLEFAYEAMIGAGVEAHDGNMEPAELIDWAINAARVADTGSGS